MIVARNVILRPTVLSAMIFIITFAVFARMTTYSFSWWDDQATIHQNPRLNPPTLESLQYYWTTADEQATMALYVPVTYTVWAGLAKIARLDHPDADGMLLDAGVFHTANVLLHALTAVLIFQLLRQLGSADLIAVVGTLFFSLHPVQVETVGWVSGGKDLLCGLFSISALLMFVRWIKRKNDRPAKWGDRSRYLAAIFLFVLAMLSKPTAVVVPLMALVISIWVLNLPVKSAIRPLVLWFVLMLPFLYWTRKYQPSDWADPLPIWVRGGVALDAIAFYFHKLFWPIHLCIDYGHNPRAILNTGSVYFTWIFPALVAAALWWRREHSRPLIAAGLLFLMPLLPVLGFVPFEFQHISTTADHYLYLSMFGVALAICFVVQRFKIPITVVAMLLVALAIRSILQEPYWKDSRALFEHALAVNPQSVDSYDNLGFYDGRIARRLDAAGHHAEAQPYFDQSIRDYLRSLSMEPTNVPSMYNLALDYQITGQMNMAREQINRIAQAQQHIPIGLRMNPLRIAKLLVEFNDLPQALKWLDQTVHDDPKNTTAVEARIRVQQLIDQRQGR